MRFEAPNEVETRRTEGIEKQGRMFVGLCCPELSRCDLTTSALPVALQQGKRPFTPWWLVFCVRASWYGEKHVGSLPLNSQTSCAPKRGSFFGGRTAFPTGDAYFAFITDYCTCSPGRTALGNDFQLNAITGEGLVPNDFVDGNDRTPTETIGWRHDMCDQQ